MSVTDDVEARTVKGWIDHNAGAFEILSNVPGIDPNVVVDWLNEEGKFMLHADPALMRRLGSMADQAGAEGRLVSRWRVSPDLFPSDVKRIISVPCVVDTKLPPNSVILE